MGPGASLLCTTAGVGPLASHRTDRACRLGDVRYGSLADTAARIGDVRFARKSGHAQHLHQCLQVPEADVVCINSFVRSGAVLRTRGFRKNIPSGDEHSRDNRTDDKSVESESRKAAKRGDQHNIIGYLGVLAD